MTLAWFTDILLRQWRRLWRTEGVRPGRAAGRDRARLRRGDVQRFRHGAFIVDLDDDGRVAALLERDRGRPALGLHPRLRAEADQHQSVRIEKLLDLFGVTGLDSHPKSGAIVRGQG